jgi:hypothetical protein
MGWTEVVAGGRGGDGFTCPRSQDSVWSAVRYDEAPVGLMS